MPERTTLSVKDFGPIAEATINLRPLTVFVGANSPNTRSLFAASPMRSGS